MSVDQYVQAIQACFPDIQVRTTSRILTGWDYVVLEVNGAWMFRFPRRAPVEPHLHRETLLLPELAQTLSIPIPRYELVWKGGNSYGPFVGYRKIQGQPLTKDALNFPRSKQLGQQLSRFLSELHSFPLQEALGLTVPDGSTAQWQQQYQDLYHRLQRKVFPLIDQPSKVRLIALFESFLGREANFGFTPVLIHGDLAGEHILWDPDQGVLTGVVDWSDSRIGDPAKDFVGLLWACGSEFTDRVLGGYQGKVDGTFQARMTFYDKLAPLHETLYGLEIRDEAHLQQGLKALQEL